MTAQNPITLTIKMEIVFTGKASLRRNGINVRIVIGNIVDGGVSMAADATIFRANHFADE